MVQNLRHECHQRYDCNSSRNNCGVNHVISENTSHDEDSQLDSISGETKQLFFTISKIEGRIAKILNEINSLVLK